VTVAKQLTIKTVFKAVDKMSKPLGKMQRRIARFTHRMKRGLKGLNRVSDKLVRGFGRVAKTAGKVALGGLLALGAGIGYVVKQFSKVEDAEAAFTPLLGGAKKAKEMVDALNQTAATTPFQLETLSGSASQLLPVMEGDIKRTVKTIRMLGDTAGGNAQKMESITRGFTKASLKGKVDMESLNMIAEAGVPIFTELAKSMGKSVDKKFFKSISAGKVSVEDLTGTFEKMTGEGGIFFKGMEIASKTTSGIFSTLKDNIQLTAASLGETLAPVIKDIMTKMIGVAGKVREWVANNQELIKSRVAEVVERLKTGFTKLAKGIQNLISNKAAVGKFFAVMEALGGAIKWVVENARGIAIVIGIIGSLIAIVKILTGVLTVINLVMAANPVVLIIMGVVALIAILTTLFIKFKVWEKMMAFFKDFSIQIRDAWEMLKDFFVELWDGIVATVKNAVAKVLEFAAPAINVAKKVGGFFGFGSEGDAGAGSQSRLVTSEQKTARMIQETRKSSTAEVTIRDATGRAALTSGELGQGVTLQPTGSY